MIKKMKSLFKRPQRKKRSFDAAGTGRLLSSWVTSNTSADSNIKSSLNTLRARARELANNNDYARKYLNLVVTNIVGPTGIKLQSKIKTGKGKDDKGANDKVEAAWKEWGKRENCTNDRSMSWLDVQRVVAESVARDGEVLIYRRRHADNPFGYSIQVIESDYIDVDYNDTRRKINMSIEYDSNGRPVYYYVYKSHPGDSTQYTSQQVPRLRIPADDIIHIYYKDRPSQSRGYPWLVSAMTRLNHLGKYEEAEIVAARVSAAKMGFIQSPAGDEYKGEEDSDGNIQIEAEPGTFEQLPNGYELAEWNPTHPSGNFDPFMKATLRGVASGLNVSYSSLTSDLEGANYSSMRAGSIDERDSWKVKQQWFIEQLCRPIFEDWLAMSLLSGKVDLAMDRFDKYNSPVWYARSWQWVDPLKDSRAAIEEIDAGIRSRTDVLAEQGKDFNDLVEVLQTENEQMKEAGIKQEPVKQEPQKDEEEEKEDE